MAFQPEDPDHKNHVIDLLQELIKLIKINNYLVGQIVGVDTTEDEEMIDDEDL